MREIHTVQVVEAHFYVAKIGHGFGLAATSLHREGCVIIQMDTRKNHALEAAGLRDGRDLVSAATR